MFNVAPTYFAMFVVVVVIMAFAWLVDYFNEKYYKTKSEEKNWESRYSRELPLNDKSHLDEIDFTNEIASPDLFSDVSPVPPYIDMNGEVIARHKQLKTDHGVLYYHPLTQRIMMLDTNGIEHDVMEEIHEHEYIWHAVSTQGGGSLKTPLLIREKAIEYVCRLGNVKIVYVDDNIKAIMYKQD